MTLCVENARVSCVYPFFLSSSSSFLVADLELKEDGTVNVNVNVTANRVGHRPRDGQVWWFRD